MAFFPTLSTCLPSHRLKKKQLGHSMRHFRIQSFTLDQGSAILSESVRNRDTEEPGISIRIDFGKFPVSVSVSESIITKIWYPTQWFWAFHQNLCYKTCLTLVSVSESESKFSLFLVSVSVSKSTRHKKSLSIEIGIEKASIAGSCSKHSEVWLKLREM